MYYSSKYGAGLTNTLNAIRTLRSFRAANLSGEKWPPGASAAFYYLSPREQDAFYNDAPTVDYVVFSYGTPIAWHTKDGVWHTVERRFSQSTTSHQSTVRKALEGRGVDVVSFRPHVTEPQALLLWAVQRTGERGYFAASRELPILRRLAAKSLVVDPGGYGPFITTELGDRAHV